MNHTETHIKNLRIAFGALTICMLIMAAGFSTITKANQKKIQEKEKQLNNLIDEVGELKEQNEKLLNVLENNNVDLEEYLKSMHSSAIEISSELKKNNNISLTKADYEEKQQKLEALLREKEIIINELAQKNSVLKDELNVDPIYTGTKSILIIGINQGLTDTIMVLTMNSEKKTITTLSVPRDLSYKGRKINELYNSYGIEKLAAAIKDITNISVSNYAIIDFNIFTQLIDLIGGVDIDVPKEIYDNAYPGPNHSYRVVTFEKGNQHMDGSRALEYARSRKSSSDFERSSRQQAIVSAIKTKIISSNLLQDLPTLLKIYASIQSSLVTDVQFYEALAMAQEYKDYTFEGGNVLSTSNYLYSTKNKSGQYILLPNKGSYADIKKYVAKLINE